MGHGVTQEWIQLEWSQLEGITLQELPPIVLACEVWGRQWEGQEVIVHCDNTGAVAVLNSGYSCVAPIKHLLWCLVFICAHSLYVHTFR